MPLFVKTNQKWNKSRRVFAGVLWAYLLLTLGAWLVLRFAGDRWWLATVLLFGPRWLFAVPLPFLAAAAGIFWRRGLWLLLVTGVILLIPIMGFCLPWGRLPHGGEGPRLRILTYNVDGKSVNAEAFATFLVQAAPDVVALQESDAETEYKWPDGWHIQRAGQLLVATRHPISHTDTLLRRYPPGPWPPVEVLRCVLETPSGQVAVCNLHLQTPREGLSEVLDRDTVVNPLRSGTLAAEIDFRRREAEHVAQWLEEFSEPFVIAGDFNMPVDSRIYQECFSNYTNAFSSTGFGFGFTKWTPIHGCSFGMRIDHILTDSDWRVRRSWIGPGAGSDHLPLLADLVKQDVPREKIQKHSEAQPTPPP